ncbi:MAG TPA: hybrid sensor histidine kinase/response regulator [Chthoniobacterales bacterium]
MISPLNTRVLIVDDEEIVRDSLRESLLPVKGDDERLQAAAHALFGTERIRAPGTASNASRIPFEIDEAFSGMEAFAKVQVAVAEARPYAVIFLDMRMPGWDGLRTVEQIRSVDTRAEVVMVTAYSDYTLEQIIKKAGANVGYHCKPFAPEEICQVATKAVHAWDKVRGLEMLINVTANLHGAAQEPMVLLREILAQVANIVGATAAILGRLEGDGLFKALCSLGVREQDGETTALVKSVASAGEVDANSGIAVRGNFAVMRIEAFRIAALLGSTSGLNVEKTYLLRLFLASAGQALENARLHEVILQNEKLSTLGSALGAIVHDLRNPVGAIQSLCELIEQELATGSTGEVAKYVELIRLSGDDAMDIVNNVLDFTRKTALEPSPVLLTDFSGRLREKSRHFLEGSTTLLEIDAPGGAVVWIDAKRLQRALLNLIKNACEVLASEAVQGPRVRVSMVEKEGDLLINVSDNGPGLPAEVQVRLFEPFATHGKALGTGLGLAIARQIVESHDGTITAESTPTGATFRMRLPQPAAAMFPAVSTAGQAEPGVVNRR